MEEIHSSTTKSNEYQEFSEDSNEDQSFLKYTDNNDNRVRFKTTPHDLSDNYGDFSTKILTRSSSNRLFI